jgi:type III restriction enzyme
MKYNDFLKQLSTTLNINIKTMHECIVDIKKDINQFLNQSTIRILKQKFDDYLMYKALNKFGIEYQKVESTVHPTKFTDIDGKVKDGIEASSIGVFHSEERVADNYLFEDLFYDSELEKENIKENIADVLVFTKIPKNSIKIPVAGGKSYSPDFAYVLNFLDGKKKIYFIVETKNVDSSDDLRKEELQKIKFAKEFFGESIDIKFEPQFNNNKIVDLIQKTYF